MMIRNGLHKIKSPHFLALLEAFENKLKLICYNPKICCRYAAKI
ncbi:hypothetical protein HPCPY1313_0361 [Helicobacter pylori CPY1313]|nr:hypothetical protein HPCPY1313_0361 [Helicobacter pylori CPY1313]